MNRVMHNLAVDALTQLEQQLLTMITTPAIGKQTIKDAVGLLRLSFDSAQRMLVSASDSNPGYEIQDLRTEVRDLLTRVDRLLDVATVYGDSA